MGALEDEFVELEMAVEQLLALLEEADERFWSNTIARGVPKIRARELAGATYVLGCYGGVETFSDFRLPHADALHSRNLNARLDELRSRTFAAASAIAARRSW